MIYYGCPACSAAMASPESLAGQFDKCPACGQTAVVPLAVASLAAPGPAKARRSRPRGVAEALIFVGMLTFGAAIVLLVLAAVRAVGGSSIGEALVTGSSAGGGIMIGLIIWGLGEAVRELAEIRFLLSVRRP